MFGTNYVVDDFFPDFLECSFAVNSPDEVVKEVNEIIKEKRLNEKVRATMQFMLGLELDKRKNKELAAKCYESVQKIDPIYPRIKEKIESVQPDKRFDSRYDYLLRNKIVDTDQLQKALALSKKMRKSVESVLMEQFQDVQGRYRKIPVRVL